MSCGIKDENGNDICLKIEKKHKHRDDKKGRGDREKGKKPLILIGGEEEV
jgi:hypothetical protein